jgi:hypothetical protein
MDASARPCGLHKLAKQAKWNLWMAKYHLVALSCPQVYIKNISSSKYEQKLAFPKIKCNLNPEHTTM